jgi:hypothetical protein
MPSEEEEPGADEDEAVSGSAGLSGEEAAMSWLSNQVVPELWKMAV